MNPSTYAEKSSAYWFSICMFAGLEINEEKTKEIVTELNQILEESGVIMRLYYNKAFLNDNYFFKFVDNSDNVPEDVLIKIANKFLTYKLPIEKQITVYNRDNPNNFKIVKYGNIYKLEKNEWTCVIN